MNACSGCGYATASSAFCTEHLKYLHIVCCNQLKIRRGKSDYIKTILRVSRGCLSLPGRSLGSPYSQKLSAPITIHVTSHHCNTQPLQWCIHPCACPSIHPSVCIAVPPPAPPPLGVLPAKQLSDVTLLPAPCQPWVPASCSPWPKKWQVNSLTASISPASDGPWRGASKLRPGF